MVFSNPYLLHTFDLAASCNPFVLTFASSEWYRWKDFLPESGENSIGRPSKPWTREDTAEVLGLSQQKVSVALQLTEAIEERLEVKSVETEEKALETLKRLKEPEIEKPKTFKCRACSEE